MKKALSLLFAAYALCSAPLLAQSENQKTYDPAPIAFNTSTEADVVGVRFNFPFGRCEQVTGFDLGFLGNANNFFGLQLNILRNKTIDRMEGIQIGLVNLAGNLFGLQAGLWNENLTACGISVGLVNVADHHSGMQIGLINRCESIDGYQIGVVNVIRSSAVPFCPVINFTFD